MQLNISLTPSALQYIAKMQQARPGHYFRLTVKKTGCSGYAYAPALINSIEPHDLAITVADLTLYIDPQWAHIMQNLQIDYVEEKKTGIKQKKLVFNNPNEAARCGCGESFHFE